MFIPRLDDHRRQRTVIIIGFSILQNTLAALLTMN
jgi:hypothetical protein